LAGPRGLASAGQGAGGDLDPVSIEVDQRTKHETCRVASRKS